MVNKTYDMVSFKGTTYQFNQFFSVDYLLINLEYMIEHDENIIGKVIAVQPKDAVLEIRKCPKCDKLYIGYPAISRRDNKTEICSQCGVLEALEDWSGEPC